MPKRFFYLFLLLLILFLPLLSSIFYKNFIFPEFLKLIFSVLLPSFIFILWDLRVVGKWWSFNNDYILGYRFRGLPLEEIMFFPVVSFSTLIIWVNLENFSTDSYYFIFLPAFIFLISFLISIFSYFKGKIYSFFVFALLCLLFIMDFLIGTKILFLKRNYIFILIVIFLTLIFNYPLTKLPVVSYNKKFFWGKRILTIPFEDFVYGIDFLILVVMIYQFF